MVIGARRVMAARAIAFYSGFATMAFEIILGRVLTPFFGGSVYTWGAVIGVFLIGMTIGFFVGGVVADRVEDPRWAGVVSAAAALLLLVTPSLTEPVGIFLLETVPDERWGAVAGSAIFGAVPAALFAMLSPYAVKLALSNIEKAGSVAGELSSLNAFGSITGTLMTTFMFIPYFGGKSIIFSIGLSALVLAVLLLSGGRRLAPVASMAAGALALALMVNVFASSSARAEEAEPSVEERAAADFGDIIETAESLYNNIFVVDRDGVIHMTFGYQDRQFVESAFDPRTPDDLIVTYTRYMPLGLLYTDTAENTALIGLGGGRTAGYLADTFAPMSVDVAEIDGDVLRLAEKYFNFSQSDSLSVEVRDGRIFLYRTRDRYDVIFLDAYRGPFVPFHLTTREFYQLAKRRLKEDGVVVQNVEPTTLLLDSTFATMKAVWDNVEAYRARGNLVFVAYDGEPRTREQLEARAAELNAEYAPRYDLAEYLDSRVQVELDDSARVLTDDFAPVELLHSTRRHNAKWR